MQSLFDPIGLLSPVLLQAKILLRSTWEDECAQLKWDDPLPSKLVEKMVLFFVELFDLEKVSFPRSLWPSSDIVGKPDLIVFSEGSILAFGTVAYIRWELAAGGYWTTLIMSKSKIAPKNRITVPRLELNGAVLAKRLREFIVGTVDTDFGNVYHMVDSSTVLGYIHKPDAKLKPFEGIRVSEIQTAGNFEDGRLKLDFRTDRLDGEIQAKNVHMVLLSSEALNKIGELLQNSSSVRKLTNTVAYMYKWTSLMRKTEEREATGIITIEEVNQARTFWIKFVQLDEAEELYKSVARDDSGKVHGRYRRLSVFVDEEGIWRVGARMREFTPFTFDRKPPAFVPRNSRLTLLLMESAHRRKHACVEETVALF